MIGLEHCKNNFDEISSPRDGLGTLILHCIDNLLLKINTKFGMRMLNKVLNFVEYIHIAIAPMTQW